MNQDKLNIGILGLGPISQGAHIEAARRGKNTELLAICDVAEDLCGQLSHTHHIPRCYHNYPELLADPDIDAVILGIAHEYHVDCALQALKAGKHVLVEKPLGVDVAACQKLKEAVEQSGLILQVGNMKRFDPGLAFAKDFADDEMGGVITMNAWYCTQADRRVSYKNLQPLPETSSHSKNSHYKQDKDSNTYTLLDHCSHLLDTARYIAGPIDCLFARYREKNEVLSWQISVNFERGGIGNLDFSSGIHMDWHEGFVAYGEHGSIQAKIFMPWYFCSSDVQVFSQKTSLFQKPLGTDSHVFKLQLEGFADTILNGAKMRGADVNDGLAAVQGLRAVQESLKTGKWMKLSEMKGRI